MTIPNQSGGCVVSDWFLPGSADHVTPGHHDGEVFMWHGFGQQPDEIRNPSAVLLRDERNASMVFVQQPVGMTMVQVDDG